MKQNAHYCGTLPTEEVPQQGKSAEKLKCRRRSTRESQWEVPCWATSCPAPTPSRTILAYCESELGKKRKF